MTGNLELVRQRVALVGQLAPHGHRRAFGIGQRGDMLQKVLDRQAGGVLQVQSGSFRQTL